MRLVSVLWHRQPFQPVGRDLRWPTTTTGLTGPDLWRGSRWARII